MRGQALATASLSRDYGLNTGFGFDRRRSRRAWRSLLSEMKRPTLSQCRPAARPRWRALLSLWPLSHALAQDQAAAAAGHLAGREFQRQAAGRSCLPPIAPARAATRARRGSARARAGRPRGLPARALHQQPRKRGGAGRLSVEDPERRRPRRRARRGGQRTPRRQPRAAAAAGRGESAAGAAEPAATSAQPPRRRRREPTRAAARRAEPDDDPAPPTPADARRAAPPAAPPSRASRRRREPASPPSRPPRAPQRGRQPTAAGASAAA